MIYLFKKLNILMFCLMYSTVYAQEKSTAHSKEKTVFFGELMYGGAGVVGENSGIMVGATFNYQLEDHHLFTLRYIDNPQFETDVLFLTPVTVFPIIKQTDRLVEYAAMYGYRWVDDGISISFSGGVSLNTFATDLENQQNQFFSQKEQYVGFPIEISLKFFKKEKKRYHIYSIIPVGKPTGIGNSFGLKLLGNISKNRYLGFALTYGIGRHKKYAN